MLKSATFLLLLAGLSLLTACNGGDDEGFNRDSLVGTWTVTAVDNAVTFMVPGEAGVTLGNRSTSSDVVMTFLPNELYTVRGRVILEDLDGVDSSSIFDFTDTIDFDNTGRWSYDGQRVTITRLPLTEFAADTSRFEVVEFSPGRRSVLRTTSTDTIDDQGVGIATQLNSSTLTLEQ